MLADMHNCLRLLLAHAVLLLRAGSWPSVPLELWSAWQHTVSDGTMLRQQQQAAGLAQYGILCTHRLSMALA
jgi:hypothetical protein